MGAPRMGRTPLGMEGVNLVVNMFAPDLGMTSCALMRAQLTPAVSTSQNAVSMTYSCICAKSYVVQQLALLCYGAVCGRRREREQPTVGHGVLVQAW